MIRRVLILALALIIAVPAFAARKEVARWQVRRTEDPITGATSCIVAAPDLVGRSSFTRVGILYPFVEKSSVHGLLVGVGTGGRFRVPSGDILWRIDDHPFRTLRAAENPPGMLSQDPTTMIPDGGAASNAMQQAMAVQARAITAATATSTVASGDAAREMLAEMLAGRTLIYRAVAAAATYGLPDTAAARMGQMTSKGLEPYPIDQSFRDGLQACGVST